MATKITARGQLTVPKRVRDALHLSAGDVVEFRLNGSGEVVLCKAAANPARGQRNARGQARRDAQMRRRAEELLALLRGLD